MGDNLYIVDTSNKNLLCIEPISFSSMGVRERQDLEEWVCWEPKILGEPLLIISTEFDKFDKSNRRLDLLALDKEGTVVIAELKLEIEGSFADQQAIRYAAFCSGMTMSDIVTELGKWSKCTEEESARIICEFLDKEDVPELHGQPRIILAAGSIDDQELTSCVLWLRQFGLDITCVEVTPYRIQGFPKIILCPRVLIPLPETQDYQVRLEKKEVQRILDDKALSANATLWQNIATCFNKLGAPLSIRAVPRKSQYMPLRIGIPHIHYEWIIRKSENSLDVALHFESSDKEENQRWLEQLKQIQEKITEGISLEFRADQWGRKWAQLMFRLPYEGSQPPVELAPQAADLMKTLVIRTYDLVKTF